VPQADYITVHMPLTPETKHMLNQERLAKTKKGVRIINCARGGKNANLEVIDYGPNCDL
jgi:D-3-phosphoglycerate dehydrogenase